MVIQLGSRGSDAVPAIVRAVEQNRGDYGSVQIRFVIVNESGHGIIYAGRIDFLHRDATGESGILEYDNIVLIKQVISVDECLQLIQRISRKEPIQIERFNELAIGGNFDIPHFIPSKTKWTYLSLDWPCTYTSYRIGSDTSVSIRRGSLVKPGLPPYPDFDHAVRDFLGLEPKYGDIDRAIIMVAPDYRARIEQVMISENKITVKIGSKEQREWNDVIGKFYLQSGDRVYTSEDLPVNDNSVSCPCDFKPEFIGAYLITASGERLDYREIRVYGMPEKDLVFETPASLIEDLIRRGESQNVEFKKEINYDSLSEGVVSFANTNDGIIIVGVDDNSKPVGFKHEISEIRDSITHSIGNRCDPPVKVEIESMQLEGNIPILLIRVPKGNDGPYVLRDRGIFVRRNATNRQITRHELDEFYKKSSQNTPYAI